jgi:hypothetical protein
MRADSTTKTIKAKGGRKPNKKVPVVKNPDPENPEANDSTTKKVNKVPTAAVKNPNPDVTESIENPATSKPGNFCNMN